MKSESKLNESRDAFFLLRSLTRIIREETDLNDILNRICLLLKKKINICESWIILSGLRNEKTIQAYWGSSGEKGSLQKVLNAEYTPRCMREAREACRASFSCVTSETCGGCPLFLHHENRQTITIPLAYRKTFLGHFFVSYEGEEIGFDKDLVNQIAQDISYTVWSAQIEDERKRMNRMQAEIMQAASEAILSVNQDGIIRLFNPAAKRLLGYKSYDVMGKPLEIFTRTDLHLKWYALKNTIKNYETCNDVDIELHVNDDQVIYIEGSISCIQSTAMGEVLYNIILRDVSKRHLSIQDLHHKIKMLTEPGVGIKEIRFEDLIEIDQIQNLLKEFNNATGVTSVITRPDGTPLTGMSDTSRYCTILMQKEIKCGQCLKRGYEELFDPLKEDNRCYCMSGKLLGAGAPIIAKGKHIATWHIGQVREADPHKDDNLGDYAAAIGVERKTLTESFYSIPAMKTDQFRQTVSFLRTMCNQISTIAYQNVNQARYISERKDYIEAIKDREKYLIGILKVAPVGISVIKDRRFLEVNNKVCALTGYNQKELLNQDTKILYTSNSDYEQVLAEGVGQRKRHGVSTVETTWKRKDGRKITVLIRSTYMDSKDPSKGIVSRIQDITLEKQREEEHEILISATEQSRDSVIVTNKKGGIIYVNPTFEKTSGYSRNDVMGENPRILKSGETDKDQYAALWQRISSGLTWDGRLVNRKKDGTHHTEDVSISPVKNSNGTITNYLAVKRDVTEQMRMKQEHAELEKQYYQTQKEESIGRLAGGIAHDLNNLLSPILGYSDLLLNDPNLKDSQQKRVQEIFNAGERARKLIQQLLSFSRKQQLSFEPVNLNTIINDFGGLLKRTIREDIAIRIKTDPRLPLINADSGKMEQIIMNLSVNAQDAMPRSGTISLKTSVILKDNRPMVELSVSDTGCGIPENELKHIFEPFYSTKGNKGTGLGLATVKNIVKQHQGGLNVNSRQEEGTVFIITFPAIQETQDIPRHKKAVPDRNHSKALILLAEDDDQVRDVASSILEQYGYTVIQAENGKKALQLLQEQKGPVDLLLSDVIMPEMNGLELLSRVKALYPEQKVLFMSGYAEMDGYWEMISHIKNPFIQKPLSIELLIGKVQEILQAKP